MATRDPERTRGLLVEAARREFADKGIAGARVDAIAERAGVNKQLVYHYFGSKDGLFREVLRSRLGRPMTVPTDEKPNTGQKLADASRRVVADPDHIRLLMWEALEAGPKGEVAEEDDRREHYENLIADIRASQEAGEIDPELDPAQVLLTRIALVAFPAAFPQVARLVTGLAVTDPEFSDRRALFLQRAIHR